MRDEERRTIEYNALAIKMLNHLSRYSRFKNEYVCPYAVTQYGISEILGVDRTRVSKELKDLIEEGQVDCDVKHVIGMKSRVMVFFLSYKGLRTIAKYKEMAPRELVTVSKNLQGVRHDEETGPAVSSTVYAEIAPEENK